MAATTINASAAGPTAGVALTEENTVVKLQAANWGRSRVTIEASDTDVAANYAPVYDQNGPTHLGPVLGRRPGVFKMDLPSGWYVRLNVEVYVGSQITAVFQ